MTEAASLVGEAAFLAECHSRAASLFNTCFRTAGTLNLVCAAGATVLSTGLSGAAMTTGLLPVLSLATAVLSGVQSFYSWQVRCQLHTILAAEYSKLSRRLEAPQDMDWNSELSELTMRAPLLPRWIVRSTEQAHRKQASGRRHSDYV